MNKWIIIGLLVFAAIFAAIALSLDNGPSPTIDDFREADIQWSEMDPTARAVVCEIWNGVQAGDPGSIAMANAFSMTGTDPVDEGLNQAKIDVMERECE